MLSPSRLSLRIPESPIEAGLSKSFRSRCFRRIVLTAVALSLCLATVVSINGNNQIRQKLAIEYVNLHPNLGSLSRLSRSKQVDEAQVPLEKPDQKSDGEKPNAIEKLMDQLPEVIRIPFEEAVEDVDLQGWEDAWFSSATYDREEHGRLAEPKMDFVYNCKHLLKFQSIHTNPCRGQRFRVWVQDYPTQIRRNLATQ